MNAQQAVNALEALTELEDARTEDLLNYSAGTALESDGEVDCECFIMDRFVEADGDNVIIRMTNLTQTEFQVLYSKGTSVVEESQSRNRWT